MNPIQMRPQHAMPMNPLHPHSQAMLPQNTHVMNPQQHSPQQSRKRLAPGPPVADPTSAALNAHRRRKPMEKTIQKKIEAIVPDAKLYTELRDMEQKIDGVVLRRKFDVQDALERQTRVKKTLRLWISNTAMDQPWEGGSNFDDAYDFNISQIPSFKLRIEGMLLDEIPEGQPRPKFSSYLHSLRVEFMRPEIYPEGNVIEWSKTSGGHPFDCFEAKRKSDMDVPTKIILRFNQFPEKYKLSPILAQILDIQEETRAGVTTALWNYIKFHNLQDPDDKRLINCDVNLQQAFAVSKIAFSRISEALKAHLQVVDPVMIDYVVKVNTESHKLEHPIDIDIEVEDPDRAKMAALLNSITKNQEITVIDDEISTILQKLNSSKVKRDFLTQFSSNPAEFIKRWIASQSKDLSVIMGDHGLGTKDQRRSEFFRENWLQESVFHYLSALDARRQQQIQSQRR